MSHIELMPLAARMRPQHVDEIVGQSHLLATGKPLRIAIEKGLLHSMILWGPPGTGKTTLAQLLAQNAQAEIENLSAVLSGVKEIREVLDRARFRQSQGKATVLFVDEIHRFNKSQQDAFLPAVESGLITLIGATTENPSFALNNALLSRARVYVLKSLEPQDLAALLQRALTSLSASLTPKAEEILLAMADGDARQMLNILEMASDLASPCHSREGGNPVEGAGELDPRLRGDDKLHVDNTQQGNELRLIDEVTLQNIMGHSLRRFDKGGDYFYDLISALHKSIRGSNPDAALYWFARMLDGGADPLYIARRLIRMANEDIGNADPRALEVCMNAWHAMERLGSPEGELALAQAVVYLAVAAKSNAVYMAFKAVQAEVQKSGSLPIPPHLCNAPTKLLKQIGKSKNYRYAHDEPHAYAAGEDYFPEGMTTPTYYHPTDRGLEKQIQEKLKFLRALDDEA